MLPYRDYMEKKFNKKRYFLMACVLVGGTGTPADLDLLRQLKAVN